MSRGVSGQMSGLMPFVLIGLCFLLIFGFLGWDIIVSSPNVPLCDRVDYNKTGYIEDIEFLGGGFAKPPIHTLIRFTNGDVVTLQGWKTEIPIKQNVTLRYHDNGFGAYFLDKFVKIGGEKK